MTKASVFLGVLVFTISGYSQVFADGLLTLNRSIEIALERSLSVNSAKEEIKAKKSEERSAKADFFPKLSAGYSYTRLDNGSVDDAKYTSYPYNPITGAHMRKDFSPLDRNAYDFNLTATQPLFTGWKLTTAHELASLGVDTAMIQKKIVIQKLVLGVKEAYFGILEAEKLEKVARQEVEQLKAHLRAAQGFFDEGITSKNDLLEAEVRFAQARQNLIRATNRKEIAGSRFNNLLRRGINRRVNIEDILDYRPVTPDLAECTEIAERNRSEIAEVSLGITAAENRVKLSKSGYYPSINLIGNYLRKGDNILLESDPGEDADNWAVILKGEWIFWEWGKKGHNVAAAKAQVAKAKDLLMEIEDNIRLEVKNAYLDLREAEKNIHVAETAIAQAEENFRMNEERFRQQVATSTDVLDAQTLLTQAKTNYFNALSKYNIAKARLERAMGMGKERIK